MSSSFYVLKCLHPDPQIGEEIRVADEVARVQQGGLLYCSGLNLVNWARSWGFGVIIDPTQEMCDDSGVSFKEAAKILKLPAGAVSSMARAGRLDIFIHPNTGETTLSHKQVIDLADQRKRDKEDDA